MSKRFIDTNLFNDEWFMNLSKDAKLLYIYLFTNCDHAGIVKLNTRLVKFQIEIKDLAKTLEDLGNRIIQFDKQQENAYFLPKFLKFQYPDFPKSNVRQQESALKILQENNIDYNSYLSVSNTYDNDSVSVSVIEHDKELSKIEKLFISTWQRKPKNMSEILAVEKMFLDHSEKHIVQAFRRAAEMNILTIAYVKGILKKHAEKLASNKEIKEAKKKSLETQGIKLDKIIK